MLESFLKAKDIPSPLIIEGERHSDAIYKIALRTLCDENSGCGQCGSCKKISLGFHPDWVKLHGSIKMEELRDALQALRQKPLISKRKVFSVEAADDCNVNVQNALLKTLEEPLAYWVLLLGTQSRYNLLTTIQSRCLQIHLKEERLAPQLSNEESMIFDLVQNKGDLELFPRLEIFFKDRQKTRSGIQQLLRAASYRNYPGHWTYFAPEIELRIPELERNLNPRLCWEAAWLRSLETESAR